MATFQITGPDGKKYRIQGENADGALAALKKHLGAAEPTQSKASGAFDAFTQGASFGFGDELTGIEAGLLGRHPDGRWFDYSGTFGSRRDAAMEAERAQQDKFADENPVLSTAAEIGGALATGAGAGRAGLTLMRQGQGVGRAFGAGLVEGGAYGGLYGAGEADGGDRAKGAAYGAAGGAAVGGPLAAVARALAGAGATKAATKAAPTTQSLKAQAGAAYDRARAANPVFGDFDQYAMQAYRRMGDEGFDNVGQPAVRRALDWIEDLSKGGTKPDFKQLEMLRRRIGNEIGGSLTNPPQARMLKMLRDGLDQYMEATGGSQAGMAAVREGRALYQRFKKGELVDEAIAKAIRRAGSTGSGGNVENAIRQNLRQILDNPRKRRGFTPDELQAIERVVMGGDMQNFLRLVGKLSPSGNGLMAALGVGGIAVNPAMAVAPAIGMAAKTTADGMTRQGADVVSALVRGGNFSPTVPQITESRRALIRALAGQSGAISAN